MRSPTLDIVTQKGGDGLWSGYLRGAPGTLVRGCLTWEACVLRVLRRKGELGVDADDLWALRVEQTRQLRVVGAMGT